MKKLINILVTLLLILFQVTVLSKFKLFGFNCNLALVSVIIVAAVAETKISIINAVLAGALFDVYACYNVGWHLVMFTIIVILMLVMVKFMYHGSLIAVAVLTALLTIATELVLYNFGYSLSQNCGSFAFVRLILPQTIINTIASIILFPFFKKINETKNKYRY